MTRYQRSEVKITDLAEFKTFSAEMENITSNETLSMRNDILLENFNEKMLQILLPAIIYAAILMFVGIPGNGVVLYVYFFKWRRSTSRMFILYLAVFDLICCMTILPMEIVTMRYSVMMDKPILCKIFRFSTYLMNGSSALVLLGIAIDRFRRICRPYQRTFSEKISKYICIGAVVISISITWPSLILYGERDVLIGPITGHSCLIENKFDSSIFPIIFMVGMGIITFAIFTALTVLYYCVGMQIYKHRQFKKKRCTHVETVAADNSSAFSNHKVKAVEGNDNAATIANGMQSPSANCLEDGKKTEPDTKCESPTKQTHAKNGECNRQEEICVNDTVNTEEKKQKVPINDHSQTEIGGSPMKRAKKPRKRVKYVLVRSASTLNASGRTKCINCVTVRIGKSTFMLFLITLAYIISFLPFYTIVIIRQSTEGFVQQMSTAGYTAYHVFKRSYLLSSAVNPIIYSFCNPQFRGQCVDLFKRIFTGSDERARGLFNKRLR